jgi:hypothetical protein
MRFTLYYRILTSKQDLKLQKDALIEKAKREECDYELFEEKESTRKTRPIKYR